jgi:hypothetical protein
MANDCSAESEPTTIPEIVARRGTKWLTRAELEAHLAAVSRLENVGVFLGSGASSGPLGGLTISQFWQEFHANHSETVEWLTSQRFSSASSDEIPNIEALADSLEIARIEWSRTTHPKLTDLVTHQTRLCRSIVDAAVLQPDWWSTPATVLDFPDQLAAHRQLLHKLTGARQPGQCAPWVFTSNYDLAIEWAAESLGLQIQNGFSGLHARSFSPHNFDLAYRNANAQGEARFGTYNIYLAKLHGSLTWRVIDRSLVVEEPASMAWPRINDFRLGNSNDLGGYVVLPSAAKYLQTVGFVLGELFRRFTDFLARPQACLIISGYSFGDEHLNRIILSALQNP